MIDKIIGLFFTVKKDIKKEKPRIVLRRENVCKIENCAEIAAQKEQTPCIENYFARRDYSIKVIFEACSRR